jgi:tetratricopeptide (TPR) repeat protein
LKCEPLRSINVMSGIHIHRCRTGKNGCFDKAIEIDPSNVNGWNNKGLDLANLGRYQEAIKCYDKVLEANTSDIRTMYNKGSMMLTIGNWKEAEKLYARILHLDPKNTSALEKQHLIFSNFALEFEKALEIAKKIAGNRPEVRKKGNSSRRLYQGTKLCSGKTNLFASSTGIFGKAG